MKSKIDNLNSYVVKYYRQNFSDIKSSDVEEVQSSIDDFINQILLETDDRTAISKTIESSTFQDSKINIVHIISKFGTVQQLNKIIDLVGNTIANSLDINQYTPLHYACIHGRIDIVKELIRYDSHRDALTSPETRKWHSIHFACRYGNLSIVKYLIELGINKELRTGFGLTPLHVACEFGKIEIVKYLTSLGVFIDPITIDENQNMTPLHYAVVGNFSALCELLLLIGSDLNKRDLNGYSSLDIAARNNLPEITELLLKWGPKNIEYSQQIAESFKCSQALEILNKYLNAKKCLFNKKTLKKLSPEIHKMMIEFNGKNMLEGKIKIFGNVSFNAYGILSITHMVGLFRKKPIEFSQFVRNIENSDLCSGIDHINEVIQSDRNELIKSSQINI